MTKDNAKKNVLIADDSYTNRVLLKKIFSSDYNVFEAENGQEAIDIIDKEEVSICLLDITMPILNGYDVLKHIRDTNKTADIATVVITANDDTQSQIKALDLGAADFVIKPFNTTSIQKRISNLVARQELYRISHENTILEMKVKQQEELLRVSHIDDKSGLYNKSAFCHYAAERIQGDKDTLYAIYRLDIDRFKIYNDMYGIKAGDKLLKKAGEIFERLPDTAICARIEADHFVICVPHRDLEINELYYMVNKWLKQIEGEYEFELITRVGGYMVTDPYIDVELMCDRALLALRSVKNDYHINHAWYDDSMRADLIKEQEIVSEMRTALDEGQFKIYIQPQHNYGTGKMSGAEVLVRWIHPKKGIISPADFIPVFERNGFIVKMDEYVWEQACICLKRWKDEGILKTPISVNISRYDFNNPYMYEVLTGLVEKYEISPKLLHLELTESAYMSRPALIISMVERLRKYGFEIEMDDFGSGYSSLNTLKDVDVDMLKLDMKFIAQSNDVKGGKILSSVVRMAHWLRIPVLAEGIETKEQADYLKSIGCLLMQGYYFARPMPVEQFEEILRNDNTAKAETHISEEDVLRVSDFMGGSSQAMLFFNNFVGGIQIVEYDGVNVEAIQTNDKFFEVLNMERTPLNENMLHIQTNLYEESKEKFIQMLEDAEKYAIAEKGELHVLPLEEGKEDIWISMEVRYLTKTDAKRTYYIAINNITEKKRLEDEVVKLRRAVEAMKND